MQVKILSILLILSAFLFSGCNDIKKVDTKNIPFTILERADFTLKPLADSAPKPVIAVFNSKSEFNTAYALIKKNIKELDIDWNKEFVIVVLRGSKGACKNAGLDIKKISQEKDKAIIQVLKDSGQNITESCQVIVNPYVIIKVPKDKFVSYENLTYQMIDGDNKLLAEDLFSIVPDFLKR